MIPRIGPCPSCGAKWEVDVQVETTPAPRGIIGIGVGVRLTPTTDEKEPDEA